MRSDSERTPPTILTLILLTGIATLSLNMFVPSLVNIADEFEVDYALASVSIAGYLAVTAVVMIIVGPLSDRYGRRPVILVGTLLFTLASVGCLLAENIWVFLVCRFLQAAVVAGGSLPRVIARDMLPPKEAAVMLGYISMAMAIAPMLGPMLGGVLDEYFGWRASFLAFTLFGAILLALSWADLGETNKDMSATFREQVQGYPQVLQSGVFWGYSICMSFSVGAFYAFIAGVPLVANVVFDVSTSRLGIYMGSITCGFFIGSFIAARITKHIRMISMVIAGRVLACAGLGVGIEI
ncbi:MAG: MFS transporter [Pseudomonadota bacterium]